uniref:RRM domain-containing protein n=1 Tax=Chenopodium quinoa TaxID=63459 RepID=A0A803KT14_CHEQI
MSGSTRRRLKSAIICEHTVDDASEESSARTRPLSYDEIMLKRKSKKEVEGSVEEAHEAETTRHEETVRNPDRRSRDTNGAAMKNSRDSQREVSPRKKVQKSSRAEHTHSKSDLQDSQREFSPRKNVEKRSRTEHIYSTSDLRDSQRGASPIKNVEKSSRTEHTHSRSDLRDSRQESSPRKNVEKRSRTVNIFSTSDLRDSQRGASPIKNVEKSSRTEHTHSRSDLRDSRRESSPKKSVEKSFRTEHIHSKSDFRDSQRGASPIKNAEKSSRAEHIHSRSDLRDSRRESSPRKNVEKSSRMEHTHIRSNLQDPQRESSPKKIVEKNSRTEHTHSKSENKERHDVESRSKHRHENDVRNDAESKNDRQGRMRSKIEEHSRGDGRSKLELKHNNDSVAQDRNIERNGGAYERESKRRDRSGDDEKHRMKDPVKKLDSGSRRNSEISERKEKVELSRSQHDETRSKRRRSRSQDRTKDKARRSRSSSPKARKNVLDHVHDHGELSIRSERDRSRCHSDVDRSKIPIDGSSSHHRRHGGSSSGLGGYSPRKRKSEAAVKTPSPIHSPERKSAGWDLPPGADINLSTAVPSGTHLISQTKPSNMIELAAGFSVASGMGKPISSILSNSLSAFKQASIDSVQLTQATRPMRRLYIDNIPGSATEKEIMECFNSLLLSSGSNYIRGTSPCISCMIHKEKGQALVEFLTPEDASAALSFDGRSLSGSILKIRRPKDFVEVPSGSSEKSKAGANLIRGDSIRDNSIRGNSISEVGIQVISDFVQDSPHKIFVGGIAEDLSSEMVMSSSIGLIVEIVSAFGTLKAYRFEVNPDLKEPCAFLEYTDQSVTLKACAGLNGMRLGGRVLTVAQAVPNTESVESSGMPPFYGIPEHVKPLLEMPTEVLKLSNVLDQKIMDSLSETDLEEIVEDVRLECSRFGCVVSINVVKGCYTNTAISEAKEVAFNVNTIQPPEERRDHHLNVDPIEFSVDHDDRDGSNEEAPTNFKENHAMDGVLGDKHELDPATTNPDLEGAAEVRTVEESKEDDKNLQNSDDKADNDPQEAAVIGASTIDDMERVDDSKGNHQESIQESGVSAELNADGSMVIEKSGNSETLCAEDVPELDKNSDMLEAVLELDKNNDTLEAVPLPTIPGATEGLTNENSCDRSNNLFEDGCVLVEFKRTEATCMAAHCLHGRAFDDRIVTVEYVSLKAYRERFPK